VCEDGVLEKCREFKEKNIPVRWAILDDMWADIPKFRGAVYNNGQERHKLQQSSGIASFEACPERFPNGLRHCIDKMKEYLATIPEKNKARGNGNIYAPSDVEGVSKTITTKEGSRVKDNFIEEPNDIHINMLGLLDIKGNEQVRRVYGTDGISPTLNTMQGGNRQPKILEEPKCIEVFDLYNRKQINSDVVGTITTGCAHNGCGTFLVREATKKGYAEAVEGDAINLEQPNSKTRRGRVGHGVAQTLTTSPQQGVVVGEPTIKELIKENNKNAKHQQDLLQHHEDVCRCIPAGTHGSTPHLTKTVVSDNPLRIRKLTPKECFRLMGFSDEDFAKAEAVNSNTQLYKQAGNSIVVDVIAHIFTQLKELDK
jgi:DNA (cytosine-5)-methyltransferase 1